MRPLIYTRILGTELGIKVDPDDSAAATRMAHADEEGAVGEGRWKEDGSFSTFFSPFFFPFPPLSFFFLFFFATFPQRRPPFASVKKKKRKEKYKKKKKGNGRMADERNSARNILAEGNFCG